MKYIIYYRTDISQCKLWIYKFLSNKLHHFCIYDNFCKCIPIFVILFTVKFRYELQRKLELKLWPPLNPLPQCKKVKVFNYITLQ